MSESTMADLRGRVALLTGASGGIGRALGHRLVDMGVKLALAYATNEAGARETAVRARAAGVATCMIGADLADPNAPARVVACAQAELGPIDLLIGNAGYARQMGYGDVDLETWERTLAVNLRAPFFLAQAVLPGMVERGFGRVLFMSSVAAFTGGMVGPHYGASKAGLHALVQFLARRVARSGVTVNALAPALIVETGMLPRAPDGQDLAQAVPVGRLGKPDEVADLAMAVLRNGYVTSQILSVDGGIYGR